MFKNSGSVGILVNSESKKAFWSDGSDRPNYKFYDLDKLLESLKYVRYNTYVQFAREFQWEVMLHLLLQTFS